MIRKLIVITPEARFEHEVSSTTKLAEPQIGLHGELIIKEHPFGTNKLGEWFGPPYIIAVYNQWTTWRWVNA